MSADPSLHDPILARELESYGLADRARAAGDLRATLRWLHQPKGLLAQSLGSDLFAVPAVPDASRVPVAKALATLAFVDMGAAFSVWAHRMVIEYASEADGAATRRTDFSALCRSLENAQLFGSTGLASAMARRLTGAPLPLEATGSSEASSVRGRLPWASNLFPREFLLVTATEVLGGSPRVVIVRGTDAGLTVDPFPDLLALQATASSSIRFEGWALSEERNLSVDVDRFIGRLRPRFLLLQASFCVGLAARALAEAAPHVGRGPLEVFTAEHAALEAELRRVSTEIIVTLEEDARLSIGARSVDPSATRAVVQIRLDAALLAGAASRLELKAVGGRGYIFGSATSRRLREAAFLPVQAPTEGQLRWELSRSA